LARERGIAFVRAATVGTHPRFVESIRQMVRDAMESGPHYVCPADCCKPGARR
jgi:protoporphyrin/coproporphyrin ferrochelatase